jgi:WD40 repeat protein
VTALEFYTSGANTLLLCGEGSAVKVFNVENSECLAQFDVFRGQTIHGIHVNQSADQDEEAQVVIWGGSSLMMLSRRDFIEILDQKRSSVVSRSTTVSDWILSVATSSHERSSCLLITAHNTLLKAEVTHSSNHPCWKYLSSPLESILYSAHVIWDTQDRILVAAGTAFGEILVWELIVSDHGKYGNASILFTFAGHEGSIFGVNFSPFITFSDGRINRLLASCSDDRTIRVWDMLQHAANAKLTDRENLLRETGFGKNEASGAGDTSSAHCLATAMGHASRIWGVRFLVGQNQNDRLSNVGIISFGEDSTAQQWDFTVSLLVKLQTHTDRC